MKASLLNKAKELQATTDRRRRQHSPDGLAVALAWARGQVGAFAAARAMGLCRTNFQQSAGSVFAAAIRSGHLVERARKQTGGDMRRVVVTFEIEASSDDDAVRLVGYWISGFPRPAWGRLETSAGQNLRGDMILPWSRETAPAFALLIGAGGVWIGFSCRSWAFVAGPRRMVSGWASSRIGERQWIHDRGRWATTGPVIGEGA